MPPTVKPVTFYLAKDDYGYHNGDVLLCFEDPDDATMFYCYNVDGTKKSSWIRVMEQHLVFVEPGGAPAPIADPTTPQEVIAPQPEVTTNEVPSA